MNLDQDLFGTWGGDGATVEDEGLAGSGKEEGDLNRRDHDLVEIGEW